MSEPSRVAVVTGANREDGIGLALVRELVGRGYGPVVGTYRDPALSTALLDLAEEDERVLAAPIDVASDTSVEEFGRWCSRHLERVDLLVHNAGIGSTPEPITRAPIGELERQLQVHGVGMLRVTQALLPLLRSGSVVAAISSSLGSLGSLASMGAGSTFYAPAKALQNALVRQLAGRSAARASSCWRYARAGRPPRWTARTRRSPPSSRLHWSSTRSPARRWTTRGRSAMSEGGPCPGRQRARRRSAVSALTMALVASRALRRGVHSAYWESGVWHGLGGARVAHA